MKTIKLRTEIEFEVNEDIYQRIEFYNKLQEAESVEEFMNIIKDMEENHNELYNTYQFYRLLPEDIGDTFMFGNLEDALEYVENILFCDVRRQYHGYKRTMKFFADNELDVGRVVGDCVVLIYLDAETFKLLFECDSRRLVGILSQHYAADNKAEGAVNIHKTKHVKVIGDADVASDFIFLNVVGVNGDNHLGVVF